MGQAFRRAAGRIKPASSIDSTASSLKMESVADRKPPPRVAEKARESGALDFGDVSESNSGNVLEERDPQFDAMLSQMVGRIRSKPGGKLEMGEASVVERYDRPMPKLRNTDTKSSKYEDRPAPPGTLNVAQMRHIILLHEGKADDHDGPMGLHQIAERISLSQKHRQLYITQNLMDVKGEKKKPEPSLFLLGHSI
ncbi:uncharacterized protein LOC120068322 [Benincasa hispida]|uniref:uncharacterized protein LOC120068322 n=1 Tax=Benincasa hispida TaxID=102211 RepID=UPI0018FFE104|nr:uncharacterized protein LOC120068322 [Benincasa hispida]